jgi:hypothetical protein
MIRTAIFPGLFGIFLLASCGPSIPEGPPPPPWRGPNPVTQYDDGRPTGVDALREEQMRQDPYSRGPQPGYGRDDAYGNPPAPTVPPTRDTYPYAERTANPNEVISPYHPYNVIDVTDFSSGQLARDPSNQRIFRVP